MSLGNVGDGCLSGPKKIIAKLHAKWGRVSAQQFKRLSAVLDRDNMNSLNFVDELLARCEVCRAFEKAPRTPIAGTCTVSTSNGKLRVDSFFLDDLIAVRAIDVAFDPCAH